MTSASTEVRRKGICTKQAVTAHQPQRGWRYRWSASPTGRRVAPSRFGRLAALNKWRAGRGEAAGLGRAPGAKDVPRLPSASPISKERDMPLARDPLCQARLEKAVSRAEEAARPGCRFRPIVIKESGPRRAARQPAIRMYPCLAFRNFAFLIDAMGASASDRSRWRIVRRQGTNRLWRGRAAPDARRSRREPSPS